MCALNEGTTQHLTRVGTNFITQPAVSVYIHPSLQILHSFGDKKERERERQPISRYKAGVVDLVTLLINSLCR